MRVRREVVDLFAGTRLDRRGFVVGMRCLHVVCMPPTAAARAGGGRRGSGDRERLPRATRHLKQPPVKPARPGQAARVSRARPSAAASPQILFRPHLEPQVDGEARRIDGQRVPAAALLGLIQRDLRARPAVVRVRCN